MNDKITSSNTKKEMLEAYNTLKKELEEKASQVLKPEAIKVEKKKSEVVSVAENCASSGIESQITDLKNSVSNALVEINDKLNDEIAKYSKIKQAVEFKEAELTEIYDIETAAFSLVALLEAHKQEELQVQQSMDVKKASFESEYKQRKELLESEYKLKKEQFEAEIVLKKESWTKEKEIHTTAVKERDLLDEKKRTRELEEFSYSYKRDCELQKNKLNDELQSLEKEISEQKGQFEKMTAEKELALSTRELEVAEREKGMDDLEAKVSAFPEQLTSQIKEKTNEVIAQYTLQAKNSEALLKASSDGVVNVLRSKIESLEHVVTNQESQLSALSAKLETAYDKVQDIAVKAVDSSSNQAKNITVHTASAEKVV